jgi:hypothetical protein
MLKDKNTEKMAVSKVSKLSKISLILALFVIVLSGFLGLNLYLLLPAVFSTFLGIKSYFNIRSSEGQLTGSAWAVAGSSLSILWIIAILALIIIPAFMGRIELATRKLAYNGDSASLENTVIVPTLDTPTPVNKNVIWCSSFQLAWNDLKNNTIGEGLNLIGSEEISNRLNLVKQSPNDIHDTDYYSASGFVKDGITKKIQEQMLKLFPEEPRQQFPLMSPESIVAFSYLQAEIKFKIPFFENDSILVFKSSLNRSAEITSFGIREKDAGTNLKLRDQIDILLYEEHQSKVPPSFAIDLSKYTQPYQLVIAMVEPNENLAQTIECLRTKISEFQQRRSDFKFYENDVLLVPNMFWKITHRFSELEGKYLANEGFKQYLLGLAEQMIKFRLDRTGAKLKSIAKIIIWAKPRYFVFDRPFLLYMKKRDANHPFFVMWVDNAELLTKWGE